MASTYLTRTVSSSGSDTKGTISFWVKRGNLGSNQVIVGGKKANTERVTIGFSTENYFEIQFQDTNNAYYWKSSAVYRDTFAWYNCVIQLDTSNVTATSRARAWINGEEITSWSLKETVPQNLSIGFSSNSNVPHVGARGGSSVDKYFDGLVSHLHFIDGTAYDATAFGETDATTGEWKAKTSPSVTYGTNGFFILKNGNSVTDQSGRGNNFTVGGGTLTDLKDNPDNTFATLNPLDNIAASTFSNGNNTVATVSGNAACNTSTIGALTGKWYWEVKMTAGESNSEAYIIGLVNTSPRVTGYDGSTLANGLGLRGNGTINRGSVAGSVSGWNTFAVNNIINVAIDFDNGKAYFGTNGVYGNSSNPSTASNGYSFTVGDEFWRMSVNCRETSKTGTFQCNFGNGYFGTTAVTTNSGNGYAGAEGASKFNYTVPAGYSALSTKGLNE